MRETEPDKVQYGPRRLEPPAKIRTAWWFGIYFAAQLPLISMIAAFYLFPIGLSRAFVPASAGGDNKSLMWLFLLGPYVIYLAHFIATLTVRSKKFFQILMVMLIVLVVLNLVGCESILDDLHGIN